MGLYAMGKAAAITAIKAAVDARTTTLPDGSRSLDLASLRQWVADQGNLIVANDVDPLYKDGAKAVLGTIDANGDTQTLADYIGRANWQNRPDWPTTASVSNSGAFVSSVAAARADLERIARDIESRYEGVYAAVSEVTNAVAEELALDNKLPRTVERVIESRFYVATRVSDWGEESAPGPVSQMVELDQNDNVLVTLPPVPAGRNIQKQRIYRSNAGSENAAFQLALEIDANVTSILDDKAPAELGEVCPTTTWAEPPSNLRGLVDMPNGVMAGFFDNTVCFCEPYVHYAWPVEYQITTTMPIVALGVFGQTLVVAHHGGVDYISGVDSASMSAQKDVSQQACIAPRSMVSVEGGVVYASADGLCLATGAGVQLITNAHFTREDWQAIGPSNIIGAYHERTYYFLLPGLACWALHLDSGKLTTVDIMGSAFHVDTLTDTMYVARGNGIYACFAGAGHREGTWRSKIMVMPQQTGFAWLSIESDFTAPVVVQWFGDGELRHTATVTSRAPVRLPPGRYLEHELEVTSSARWTALTLASSTSELQSL